MIGPQGQRTRALVVEAAGQLFAERGFRDTSLGAIARAAGITRQALLRYFASKGDLLLAVLEQRDADNVRAVPAATVEADDLPTALMKLLMREGEHAGLTQLLAVATAESLDPGHPTHDYFRARYARNRNTLIAAVDRQRRRGNVVGDLDSETIAVALNAAIDGLNIQQLLEPDVDHGAALNVLLQRLFTR